MVVNDVTFKTTHEKCDAALNILSVAFLKFLQNRLIYYTFV